MNIIVQSEKEKMTTEKIISKDGIELTYYKFLKEGEVREKIFIFTAPGQAHTYWLPIMTTLSRAYDVYLMDYRGFPNYKEMLTEDKFTMDNYMDDVNLILEKESISKAHMIFWCVGLKIGYEFYNRYPEKFKSIILLNPSVFADPEAKLLQNLVKFIDRIENNPKDIPKIIKLIRNVGTVPSCDFIETVSEEENESPVMELYDILNTESSFSNISFSLIDNPSGLVNYLRMVPGLVYIDNMEDLKKTKVPFMALYGEKDNITPITDEQIRSIDDNTNSEYHVIKNGSHYMGLEYPNKISEIIRQFIEKVNA